LAFSPLKDATKALWRRLPEINSVGNSTVHYVTEHIVATIAAAVKSFARFAPAATEGIFIAMTARLG
jgi:hypothetical protein